MIDVTLQAQLDESHITGVCRTAKEGHGVIHMELVRHSHLRPDAPKAVNN